MIETDVLAHLAPLLRLHDKKQFVKTKLKQICIKECQANYKHTENCTFSTGLRIYTQHFINMAVKFVRAFLDYIEVC